MLSHDAIEHFHRNGYARAVRVLSRICGHHDAEAAVQEAFIRALRVWTPDTMPADPSAWLMRVSRRCAIDQLRRNRTRSTDPLDLDALFLATSEPVASLELPAEDGVPADDTLRQLFACALPDLPHQTRASLLLRHVCSLSVYQIAAVFRSKPATTAQQLSRAHARLNPQDLLQPLSGARIAERLPGVLDAIYLAFSVGFHEIPPTPHARSDDDGPAPPPDPADSLELVTEALRLGLILHRSPPTATPETCALLATMLFHAARLPARRDAVGRLLSLGEQDRSRWDTKLIDFAFQLLANAQTTASASEYHIHAGIAACHAIADSMQSTDWERIAAYYDLLGDTPPNRLARTVALSYAQGPDAALPIAQELLSHPGLAADHRIHALLADLYARLNQRDLASRAYRTAADLTHHPAERDWLLSKAALPISPRATRD